MALAVKLSVAPSSTVWLPIAANVGAVLTSVTVMSKDTESVPSLPSRHRDGDAGVGDPTLCFGRAEAEGTGGGINGHAGVERGLVSSE